MINDFRTEGQVRHHGVAVVNGPDGDVLEWHWVDWGQVEDDVRFGWTKIIRHQLVPGWASPDDPALADYWARRRRRNRPPLDRVSLRLLQKLRGRCPACGELLLSADHEPRTQLEWEQWVMITRRAVRKRAVTAERATGTDDPGILRLLHTHCRPHHYRQQVQPVNPASP